jgi:Peroxisomal biogenesis factor 11 (PEX11).
MFLAAYYALIPPLSPPLSLFHLPPQYVLHALASKLGFIRRPFRLFRFLEAFTNAYESFRDSPSSLGDSNTSLLATGTWVLDILSQSFMAVYLLLESATFPDLLMLEAGAEAFFGRKETERIIAESQKWWFVALATGVLAGVGRLWLLRGAVRVGKRKGGKDGDEEKKKEWEESVIRQKKWKIVRKMAADVMDLSVPGSIIGWVPVSQGTVGFLMFWSTVLTASEVWERCGREIAEAKAGLLKEKSA